MQSETERIYDTENPITHISDDNLDVYNTNNRICNYCSCIIIKILIMIFKFIKQLAFLIIGIILYCQSYDNTCGFLSQVPLLISFNCVFVICYYIMKDFFRQNNISRCRYNLIRSLTMSTYITSSFLCIYCIMTFTDTFKECDELSINKNFLLFYIFIEFLLPTLLSIILVFIIYCGLRMCFPNYLMMLPNNLPIRLGASDEELNKLISFKYNNNLLDDGRGQQIVINEDDALCGICMDNYDTDKPIIVLSCNHHFHKDCCNEWLKIKQTCPNCRCNVIF